MMVPIEKTMTTLPLEHKKEVIPSKTTRECVINQDLGTPKPIRSKNSNPGRFKETFERPTLSVVLK